MNIDNAIRILSLDNAALTMGFLAEFEEAVKLGLEALKRILAGRVAGHILWEDLLPGETEK